MNVRFGAPGRIVFRDGFAGYPEVVLANKYGTATVALLGANVLSYRPTGHFPVLFRPAKRDYLRGESFHGGIPVCWPQFGKCFSKELPQHGFARLMPFDVKSTTYGDEQTLVVLSLDSTDETKRLWPYDFELEIEISVSMKLNLKMTTKNTGNEPFAFSAGFHPYFAVRSRDTTLVRGLENCSFVDGRDSSEGVQTGDLRVDFAPDHIFSLPPALKHELAILDDGLKRAIAIVSAGNDKAVVWNCGEGAKLADFGEDDWRKYVCVEPVTDWPGGRTLAPNEKHELLVAIQSALDGGRVAE